MKLRILRGLSQQDLATALGVTTQTIYNWESGRSVPKLSVSQFKVLLNVLQVTPDELPENFGPEESKSPLQLMRERVDLSREEVAEKLKKGKRIVEIDDVKQWEEKEIIPDLSLFQIARLCKTFGITIEQLAACFSEED